MLTCAATGARGGRELSIRAVIVTVGAREGSASGARGNAFEAMLIITARTSETIGGACSVAAGALRVTRHAVAASVIIVARRTLDHTLISVRLEELELGLLVASETVSGCSTASATLAITCYSIRTETYLRIPSHSTRTIQQGKCRSTGYYTTF